MKKRSTIFNLMQTFAYNFNEQVDIRVTLFDTETLCLIGKETFRTEQNLQFKKMKWMEPFV